MIQFNSDSEQMFILDGISHYRKFFSNVRGTRVRVYNAYNPLDVLVDYVEFSTISVNGVTYPTVQQLQVQLLKVIYNGAVGTGTDFEQDNVFIPRQITYSGEGSEAEFSNMVNQLQPFTVGDKQLAIFTAVNPSQPILKAKKFVFVISKIGKGTFGSGQTQLTADNIFIASITQPREEDIIGVPTTQFIDFGILNEGEDVSTRLNSTNPAILLQDQSAGYVVFKTIIAGNPINYLFLSTGGTYGLGQLQTTLDDFLQITDWFQDNEGVEEAPNDGFLYGRKNKTWSKVDVGTIPPTPNINQVLTVGNTAIDKAQKFNSISESQYSTEQNHKGYKAISSNSSALVEATGVELKYFNTKLRIDPYRAVFTKGNTELELNTRDNVQGSFKQEFQAKSGIVALLSDIGGGSGSTPQNINDVLNTGSVATNKIQSFVSSTTPMTLGLTDSGATASNGTFISEFLAGSVSAKDTNGNKYSMIRNSGLVMNQKPNNTTLKTTLVADKHSGSDKLISLPNANGTLIITVNGQSADDNGNIVVSGGSGETPLIDDVLRSDNEQNIVDGDKKLKFYKSLTGEEVDSTMETIYTNGNMSVLSHVDYKTNVGSFDGGLDLSSNGISIYRENIDDETGNNGGTYSGTLEINTGQRNGMFLSDTIFGTNAGQNQTTAEWGSDIVRLSTKGGLMFQFSGGLNEDTRQVYIKADNIARSTGDYSFQLPRYNGTPVMNINGIEADAEGKITIPTGSNQNIDQTLQIGSVAIDKQINFRSIGINPTGNALDIDKNEVYIFNDDMSKSASFSNELISLSKKVSENDHLMQLKTSEIIFGNNNGSITLERDSGSTGTHVNKLPENTGYLVASINGAKPDKFGNVDVKKNESGQVKVNYTGLIASNFTSGVVKTLDINSATHTLSDSPTTVFPKSTQNTYAGVFDSARGTAPTGRLIENPVAGQVHTWRFQFTYNGKASGSNGSLDLILTNPVSGFQYMMPFTLPSGRTSGSMNDIAITIADNNSISSPNGYVLQAVTSFNDANLSVEVNSITRISQAMEIF